MVGDCRASSLDINNRIRNSRQGFFTNQSERQETVRTLPEPDPAVESPVVPPTAGRTFDAPTTFSQSLCGLTSFFERILPRPSISASPVRLMNENSAVGAVRADPEGHFLQGKSR